MNDLPRLNKYLVSIGLADSRRKADELIKSGVVKVNNSTLLDLAYRVAQTDIVEVTGKTGIQRADIYIAYNKPRGLVCSHTNQGNHQTIFSALPKTFSSLKIAGRLDKDSQGLMILSSDGDFIQKVTHPKNQKSKAYIVTAKQKLTDKNIKALNTGVALADGLSLMKASSINSATTRITISEGRNRQIRRTFTALGLDVIKLERIRIGDYSNPHLGLGEHVFIKPQDVIE